MNICDQPKMRAIIKKHLGEEHAKKYDEIIDTCKLGNALKDERTWAPLCPEYPNLKGVTCEEIERVIKSKTRAFFHTTKAEDLAGIVKDTLSQEQTIDYLHNVKVYDRDEEYAAFKKIGDQIEKETPGLLHDGSTIFVTTPRGGHEMLSIFAYANDIIKEQIPSDIVWEHNFGLPYQQKLPGKQKHAVGEHDYKKDPKAFEKFGSDKPYKTVNIGKNWVTGDTSAEIKTIFIVDDIIASGSQLLTTSDFLRQTFPDAEINSITLCKRENVPEEGTFYEDDDMNIVFHKRDKSKYRVEKHYTDTETIGIRKFKKQTATEIGTKPITCLFPHACPDGESDKPMIELMGDKRCSPEKRISRKDL